jgi:lipoic acid synthetase
MQNLSPKRPPWLKRRIPASTEFGKVNQLLRDLRLNTVCMSAHCPNIGECFGSGTATFLILGGVCTRSCGFCSVPGGSPLPVEAEEADNVAKAALSLGLKHVVITSVTRDDLRDGGAGHFAACIAKVRELCPAATIEVLTPDFLGSMDALAVVLNAGPDVFNHNIETVPGLYSRVRPQADYQRSLAVLRAAAQRGRHLVKSGIMVGLGETAEEIGALFSDLAAAGVSAVTVGQYLRPSPGHLPIVEYVHPDMFRNYEEMACKAGIKKVSSGPFVRSSYHAGEMMS